MHDPYNHKIVEATDDRNDEFFTPDAPRGKGTGIFVAYLTHDDRATKLVEFLFNDLDKDTKAVEAHSNPRAFNGGGRQGTWVRFVPAIHTVDEVRAFVATLA